MTKTIISEEISEEMSENFDKHLIVSAPSLANSQGVVLTPHELKNNSFTVDNIVEAQIGASTVSTEEVEDIDEIIRYKMLFDKLSKKDKKNLMNDLIEAVEIASKNNDPDVVIQTLEEWEYAIEVGYSPKIKEAIKEAKEDISKGKAVPWKEAKKRLGLKAS